MLCMCVCSDAFLSDLVRLDTHGRRADLAVPREVIDGVEAGRNPHTFTQRMLNDVLVQNESVRAKVFAAKVLHDQLDVRMQVWMQHLRNEAAAGHSASDALQRTDIDALLKHTCISGGVK